jgi:hypothetical protein
MLVPSKTANGPPACRSVDERIWPPGAETSGFRLCSKAVGPPEEKLVTIPPRPVSVRSGALVTRIGARPPTVARASCRRAPSRSEIIPPGTASATGIEFASPGRLSTTTIPTAPAARARAALEANVQAPRETSATAPVSVPRRSGFWPAFGSRPIPQSRRSTGVPEALTIDPTSTRVAPTVLHPAGRGRIAGTRGT